MHSTSTLLHSMCSRQTEAARADGLGQAVGELVVVRVQILLEQAREEGAGRTKQLRALPHRPRLVVQRRVEQRATSPARSPLRLELSAMVLVKMQSRHDACRSAM